jgi:cytochrome-b5 reductase
LKNPSDRTKINLIFANITEADILLRDELDSLISKHPKQFAVYYVLNEAPAQWTGGVGFVNKEMISKHIPAPGNDVKLLLCGPPPMIKAMTGLAEELGFAKPNAISKADDQVFKF